MRTVDSINALSDGSDVWMVASLEASAWARRIDWYLNLQMLRSEARSFDSANLADEGLPVPARLTPELERILEKNGFEAPIVKVDAGAPLMVATLGRLPTNVAVLVPLEKNANEWASSCHRVWKELGSPRVRVFLPDAWKVGEFESAWPKTDRTVEVEIVPPSE